MPHKSTVSKPGGCESRREDGFVALIFKSFVFHRRLGMNINSSKHALSLAPLLGLFIGSIVGCAPSDMPEGMPELHPVTLTIVQSGTPLEGATIQLVPQDAANIRWACGGTSDATGKVVVQTLGKFPGAPIGSYKATIYKTLVEDMTPGVEDSPSSTKVFETFLLVDPKFQSAETTTIEVTVASGENNPPPIDLGAPVKLKQKQP